MITAVDTQGQKQLEQSVVTIKPAHEKLHLSHFLDTVLCCADNRSRYKRENKNQIVS
jgi:hypothetical protein